MGRFKMTPTAQHQAIAKLMSYQPEKFGGQILFKPDAKLCASFSLPEERVYIINAPEYSKDLNAINKAINYARDNIMDSDQWEAFGRMLVKVHPTATLEMGHHGKIDYYDFATLMTSGPEIYCEALLKTLNLWNDSK